MLQPVFSFERNKTAKGVGRLQHLDLDSTVGRETLKRVRDLGALFEFKPVSLLYVGSEVGGEKRRMQEQLHTRRLPPRSSACINPFDGAKYKNVTAWV